MNLENRIAKLEGIVEKLEQSQNGRCVLIFRDENDPDIETAIRKAGYDPEEDNFFIVIQALEG